MSARPDYLCNRESVRGQRGREEGRRKRRGRAQIALLYIALDGESAACYRIRAPHLAERNHYFKVIYRMTLLHFQIASNPPSKRG